MEPIALARGVARQQLQYFVGVSPWDHLPLLDQLQGDVAGELGDPEGVLVLDGSAMPKKGNESVGGSRPPMVRKAWQGR